MSARPKLALIAGPTASGKSALALSLAERTGGVIVNGDASQVYGDLRIVTARPAPGEEARAPHRLFGHVDAADTGYSAARWADEAKAEIAAAHGAGRLPILVGGTGLYMRTLLDGIAPIPPIDPAIRNAARELPVADAYAALLHEDPAAAHALAPADSARIARALEVVRSTGRPIGEWRRSRSGGIAKAVDLRAAVLLPDRKWLGARIDARFAAMLESGAIEEVAALLARADVPANAPVRGAIGVREIAALVAGEISREQARERGAAASRQYAKRQYTWFRNQPPSDWLRVDPSQNATRDALIEILLRFDS